MFTINNATENEWVMSDCIDYLIVGKEVSDGGTPHLQGYVCFHIRKRLDGAKKIFPRAHMEIVRGTVSQAIMYCKKDGNWKDWGEPPKSAGQKVHDLWEKAYNSALEGKYDEIPKCILVRNYHAFKRIRQDNPKNPKALLRRSNVWIYAPSGYGKSTYARETYPDYYDKAPNKWFVGYRNESVILCDDWGPDNFKYLGWYIKRWADLFPFPMESKGGGEQIRPQSIIVTSQYSISECFPDELEREAIENRFTVINLTHWRDRLANQKRLELLLCKENLDPNESY